MRDHSGTSVVATALALLVAGSPSPAAGQAEPQHQHGDAAAPERLGTVDVQTSCAPAVRTGFNRAAALLHSFSFRLAIEGFEGVLRQDPSCGMAAWGIALANWGNPFAGIKPVSTLEKGTTAVARARSIGAKTPRERDYIAAVAELYKDYQSADHGARITAYADAMTRLASTYPDDEEAQIFSALATLQTAAPTDKTYAKQLEAGAVLEALFAKHPDHPGLAHYIIHAYDVPPLAPRAVAAARRYAQIAPSAPHALHMPSHTFTRLGYWRESVESNLASAAAARAEGASAEELHAMDYMAYAYLQMGRDEAARDLVSQVAAVRERLSTPTAGGGAAPITAGAYAAAAIPARYALERGDWTGAGALVPTPDAFIPAVAITRFARALGAARAGRADVAGVDLDRLAELRDRMKAQGDEYWAGLIEIQRQAASAWVAWAQGRAAEAIATATAAADAEDATEKAAISPGPLAPSRELLADMLLESKRPAEARRAYEAVIAKEPGRLRSEFGAGLAAERAGDLAGAAAHYRTLLTMCEHADVPGRDALQHARTVVSAGTGLR